MASEDQETFLFNRLNAAVEKYRSESKQLKRWTFGIRITALLLAALSTILLGWNPKDDPGYTIWSRNIALALGAISTFIIGVSSFWNVETYWLKQKVLYARVRALKERCYFLKAKGNLTPGEINAAFDEYRAMMDDRIDYWEKLAAQSTPKKSMQPAAGASAD